MIKRSVFVFGSASKFAALLDQFRSDEYSLVHISEEDQAVPFGVRLADDLVAEFESHYVPGVEVAAFVAFGRGSATGSAETIAYAIEKICKKFPECGKAKRFGPSAHSAELFSHKFKTYETLLKENLSVPKTLHVALADVDPLQPGMEFPFVVKAEQLSGGRGMWYVNDTTTLQLALDALRKAGVGECIFSEYVLGVEATLTVLRLGETFLRLPTSYKRETDLGLLHPDEKVKVCGMFREFDEYFEQAEILMRKYDIHGLFSLQGVLCKEEVGYAFKILETATRFTGSTPAMVAALSGFNIFETIANWIKSNEIAFVHAKKIGIQYASVHPSHESEALTELSKLDWVVEAKSEHLGSQLLEREKKVRIRISFAAENEAELQERLQLVAHACKSRTYAADVKSAIGWFKEKHPMLCNGTDTKVAEGFWNDNVRWEFYLASALPLQAECASIFGIPFTKDGVALTQNQRGWELPGGHIVGQESLAQALKREVREEVGVRVDRCILFGYRKVIATTQQFTPDGDAYPHPVSYIPHCLIASDTDPVPPTGTEVLGVKFITKEDTEAVRGTLSKILDAGIQNASRIK